MNGARGADALVGRDEDLERISAELKRPGSRGALIIGEGGVGKSALANALAVSVAPDLAVFRVYASAALSGLPYGALAPLLPALADEDADSPLAVMRAVMHGLDQAEQDDRPPGGTLVVVDDAHDLDEQGADLLAQLAAAGRIRLLLLTRSIHQLPAGLPAEVWDGFLARFRLRPLTVAQVQELCERRLGGPMVTASGTELAALSGGNPMFVLALLEEAVRAEGMVRRNGVWLLERRTLPPDGRLGDLLRAQLAGLSLLEREAFELIALAEPLPLAAAFRLGLHRCVDVLADARLVTVGEDGSRLLRPRYPLHAEVVRRMVPAARSSRLRRSLLAAVPDVEESPEQLLRQVSWALDLGEEVAQERLLEAARRANESFQPKLARRAAGAVRRGDLLIAARVELARSRLMDSDADGGAEAAAQLVQGCLEEAPDLLTLRNAALTEALLRRWKAGAQEELEQLAGRWEAGITRLGPTTSGRAEAWALRGVRLLRCFGRMDSRGPSRLESELLAILAEARQTGDTESVVAAQVSLADLYVMTGRAETALEPARGAFAQVQENGSRQQFLYQVALHRYTAALLWTERWDELRTALAKEGDLALRGQLPLGGMADVCLAVMHLRTGAFEDALERLKVAVEGLRSRDPEGMLPLALGLAAVLAAQADDGEFVTETLRLLSGRPITGARPYQLIAQGYAVAARAIKTGERDLSELHAVADTAAEEEQAAAEFDLRSLAVRLGDLSNIGHVLKIAEVCQGPQAKNMRSFARAVLDQDITELLRLVPEDPRPDQRTYLEDQCLNEALRLARRSGDRTLAHRIQRRIGRRASAPSGVSTTLTRRERDIAALVAQGLRNAEIASRLFLSVRTVEGHIYRTFEKLGISRREELADALTRLEQGPGASR